MRREITQEKLKRFVSYDKSTGVFTWKVSTNRRITIGSRAGCKRHDGYLMIKIDGVTFLGHRLAFIYMTGKSPNVVDHIDKNPANNTWSNLRESSYRMNMENKRTNNGFIGVHWCNTNKKWRASTPKTNGKRRAIGQFRTHLAACYARHSHEVLTLN